MGSRSAYCRIACSRCRSCSESSPIRVRRAVQVTVPAARASFLNAAKSGSIPLVICTTPPPFRPTASASGIVSDAMSARRLGTGLPAKPTCRREVELEKPSAPAAMASPTIRAMASTSSGRAERSVESSPITSSRTAEWPTIAPTLTAVPRVSMASRYSAKLSNRDPSSPSSSASRLMPSTFSSICISRRRLSGFAGATPKPQLPMTTLVTPCHGEMVSMGSHIT